MDQERRIAQMAHELTMAVPLTIIDTLADVISSSNDGILTAEVSRKIAHHRHRETATVFVSRWRAEVPDLSAQSVAIALRAAVVTQKHHRDSQSVELVWTGPDVQGEPFRRTEQAILQLLDAAKERITLVSFAVYSIPNIAKALISAAARGVRLTVIIETPDKLGGENEYSTLRALGKGVADCSTVYYWPKEKRSLSESGKPGILHVKCAVADDEWMFLSSANLTQQAFTINMELGVLVRGGSMPRSVQKQFDLLIKSGKLKEL